MKFCSCNNILQNTQTLYSPTMEKIARFVEISAAFSWKNIGLGEEHR